MSEVTGKCEKCGATFDFDSSFIGQVAECPSCGQSTTLSSVTKSSESFKAKEETLATLGQTYTTSVFVAGDGLTKTSVTLTSEKISGIGKKTTLSRRSIISFSGILSDVSSIAMHYSSPFYLLILGLFFSSMSLFGFMLSVIGIGNILIASSYAFSGGLCILIYYLLRQRFIEINFSGVSYMLSLRGISNEEVNAFIEKVLIAKNK